MLVKLKDLLEKHEQEHLLQFWDQLSKEEQQYLENDLINTNISKAVFSFKKAVSSVCNDKISDEKIKPVDPDLVESYGNATFEKLSYYEELGHKEIMNGKMAVVLMAGGQGTRLGVNYPKGMYSVKLPSNRTLFHIQALRIKRLQNIVKSKYGESKDITWYIMTSDATHKSTKEYFRSNNYFGLNENNVLFFKQGTMPCFTFEGKIILDEKYKISKAPDGNGGLYEALTNEGMINDMVKRGINSVHAYSVDNILIKVADPIFVGYCISRSADFGNKVIPKRSANEPVGVVCEVDGKYKIVEYSEMSSELAELVNEKNELIFNCANICNHYFSLQFLQNLSKNLESNIDLHIAKKKIPYIDSNGVKHTPEKPNGIKIEKFVFDVLKCAKKFVIWKVLREEEFSALKNSDSDNVDCPSTAKRDILNLHRKWLLNAGANSIDGEVEICPLTSYQGENLNEIANNKCFKGPLLIQE